MIDRPESPADEAAIRRNHTWDAYAGHCRCGWESPSDRGAEREHARHVERVLRGLPR